MLLEEYRNHPSVQDTEAIKYITEHGMSNSIEEKNRIIDLADLTSESTCLDISTGIGLLPYLLRSRGHSCDATDISEDTLDVDRKAEWYKNNNENFSAYEFLRSKLNVKLIQRLDMSPGVKINLSLKYDCIFSTRIVWINNFRKEQDYIDMLDQLKNHTTKVVFHFNFHDRNPWSIDKGWDSIMDYKCSEQLFNGNGSANGTLIKYEWNS